MMTIDLFNQIWGLGAVIVIFASMLIALHQREGVFVPLGFVLAIWWPFAVMTAICMIPGWAIIKILVPEEE